MDPEKKFNLILASNSPRRKELVSLFGMPVEFLDPKAEEKSDSDIPEQIVVDIASDKLFSAELKIERTDNYVIIAADTAVFFQGEMLGKPQSPTDAFEMLKSLSGNWHEVYSGVALKIKKEKHHEEKIYFAEKTRVKFRKIPESTIHAYVNSKKPMDKAGSYGIQDEGAFFVEQIIGDFYNVMGLPIGRIWETLLSLEVINK